MKSLSKQRDCVRDVSWHPYSNDIVGTSWDTTICKWDFKSMDDDDQKQIKAQNDKEDYERDISKKIRLHF